MEEVSVFAINLIWRPTGKAIRFILAVSSRGPIVLMCSDLHLDPIVALQLYCSRTRVETMFDFLKNLIGAFNYKFRTRYLPRHCRKPPKKCGFEKATSPCVEKVERCWQAYERFVLLGAISLGLLQLIALKFSEDVRNNFTAYIGTRSRDLPSERTTKCVLSSLLVKSLFSFKPDAIIREIRTRFLKLDCSQENEPTAPVVEKSAA